MPRQPVTTVPLRKSTRIRDAAIAKAALPPPPPAALRRPKFPRMVNYDLNEMRGGNLTLRDFNKGRKLGDGSYGEVYLATRKKSKVQLVLKRIPNVITEENGERLNIRKWIKREIDAHKKMMMYTYIVMEFAEKGDLIECVQAYFDEKKVAYFGAKRAAQYIYQMADALMHCHSKNVFHRDVKMENILIGSGGELKLCDFGGCINESNRRDSFNVGTLDYIAPEVARGEKYYSELTDIWALGILAHELLIGKTPFDATNDKALLELIKKGDFNFPLLPMISNEAKDLISGLLKKKPEDRMKLEDVLTHPFITNNK